MKFIILLFIIIKLIKNTSIYVYLCFFTWYKLLASGLGLLTFSTSFYYFNICIILKKNNYKKNNYKKKIKNLKYYFIKHFIYFINHNQLFFNTYLKIIL